MHNIIMQVVDHQEKIIRIYNTQKKKKWYYIWTNEKLDIKSVQM